MLSSVMATVTKPFDLPAHLERYRVEGSIDLTRPLDPFLSDQDRLILMRAAIAEGDADFELGQSEDAEAFFQRLRAEFRY